MTEHRVVFDFEIDFSNGGGLQGQGFRLDIDGDAITDEDLAASIVRDLRLLMVADTRILKKSIVAEAHKRTAPPEPVQFDRTTVEPDSGPRHSRPDGHGAVTRDLQVRTCLWFEKDGLAAARFYTGLLPDSALETDPTDGAEPLIVAFSLGGVPYQILNGGPHYRPTPAASIVVSTPDQTETDRLWDALTADGGAPGRCGWLTDRWGVSWQIVPEALPRLLGASDRAAAGRARDAMMQMSKIDIAALDAAFDAS